MELIVAENRNCQMLKNTKKLKQLKFCVHDLIPWLCFIFSLDIIVLLHDCFVNLTVYIVVYIVVY